MQYEATSSNASANRNTQAQPQSIAQVQVGSSQSMLLQPVSMGQHQQPIQWMQPLSQGTSSIPPFASSPYVGSSSGTSSLLGQDINSVATLGAQIPVAAASTQWMNLTTLTGASAKSSPIVGGLPAYPNDLRAHAPTSIPSIPVHTATPSGAYMGPATTSASTANFNQSSLPPPLSIPISTPASIPLSTPILTSLPNVRPVMTSSPALPVQSSLPALSPVVLAQAPVTTSNAPISNAVDPVIKPVSDSVAIDDDTQNSPRRLTRHRQKVDNTETPVNVPSEPTSSGKQPPEAMSTRRGAIAQPPPVKNTPTGTQGVASALTKRLTSPPTVVKKRGAEVVSTASKASAADTSDSIRRSKRISN